MMRKRKGIFLILIVMFMICGFSARASETTTISVMTENIQAPGTAEIEIDLPDHKTIDAVNMVFRMKENPEKMLYYWLIKEDIYLSEANGSNICTLNLAENVPVGTYQLVEIELIFQEEVIAKYVSDDSGLKDWSSGYEMQGVDMTVHSGCQDTDFVTPELVEIQIEQKAEAGKTLKAIMQIKDTSGMKSADLVYYNESMETYLFLYPEDMSCNKETEEYTYIYKIPKYQEAGDYVLDAVCLTDNSAYENSVTYWRVGSNLTDVQGRTVSAKHCRYLKINYENSDNSASILEENLYWTVMDAKIKSTVIYRGGDSDGSLWILDYNSLRTAKRRQLTLILPDMLTDSEIIIDASKAPVDLKAETYAGFILKKLSEGLYDIKLQMTHEKFPFTVKLKMKGFDEQREYEFQLSRQNDSGDTEVIEESLIIDNEGYLVLEFPDGLPSADEWNQFQLTRTERADCNGKHEWGEEILVEKATLDKEGYTQKECKNCEEIQIQKIPKIQKVTLSTAKYIYNGSSKTPAVTIKDADKTELIKGTDYDVEYPAVRKNTGRYYVTVNFKGKYDGTAKKYFTIVPKAVTDLNAVRYEYGNQIRISWKKSTGATGYRIYQRKTTSSTYTYVKSAVNNYFVCGGLTQNAAYRFKVVPYYKRNGVQYYSSDAYATVMEYTSVKGGKLVQIQNVKAAKKGTKVKVSWKNAGYETGYQISRSTSKTGTNIVKTYKTTKGTSQTVSATKGKTYYYKVRAYRTVNNRNIYGAWSEPVKYVRK